jgi:hypothetical protein
MPLVLEALGHACQHGGVPAVWVPTEVGARFRSTEKELFVWGQKADMGRYLPDKPHTVGSVSTPDAADAGVDGHSIGQLLMQGLMDIA